VGEKERYDVLLRLSNVRTSRAKRQQIRRTRPVASGRLIIGAVVVTVVVAVVVMVAARAACMLATAALLVLSIGLRSAQAATVPVPDGVRAGSACPLMVIA
jgi:hypothetical protein